MIKIYDIGATMGFTKNKVCLTILILLSWTYPYSHSFGQILEFDQNPPSLNWRQINTPNFQVIYPSEFENQAQSLSSKLEEMIKQVEQDMGIRPKKISIILQNQSVLPNGFVQLAPRRSEFVVTPPAQGEMEPWLDHLAIHELRHVVQFDKLVGGFKAPFLEQLGLAIFGIVLPSWFFEGDAVLTETQLTNGGRGRIPSWVMPLRANLLEGKKFSYQKDYLGSYRDITPGFYELGYFMTDKLHRQMGSDITSSLLDRISTNFLRPYNFSQSLKRFTGFSTKQWHHETMDELRKSWQQQIDSIYFIEYPSATLEKRTTPSNWILPQALPNGEFTALFHAYDTPAEIQLLDSLGHKKKSLVKIGWQTSYNYSYAAGKLVWDELRKNPRYAKQTFSVIKTHHILSGKTQQITSKTRLFTPSLSTDGNQIACIEVLENNQVNIVLLNWSDGRILKRFNLPEGWMVQTPSFHDSGNKLVSVAISQQGANILELDIRTGEQRLLLDWQHQQIERPVYKDDDVLFKAHFDGIDNIFLLNTDESTNSLSSISKITHSKLGAFDPSITENGELLFSNYEVDGFKISRAAVNKVTYPKLSISKKTKPTIKRITDSTTWDSAPYKDRLNLFNFHSLSVTPGDFSSIDQLNPGIYWLSDNLLNTLQTRLGFVYDSDISRAEYHAKITYQRFFPKFSLSYQNRGRLGAIRRDSIDTNNQHLTSDTAGLSELRWRENSIRLQASIPLTFYQGNQYYSMGFNLGTSVTERYGLSVSDEDLKERAESRFVSEILFPMEYTLYFGRNLRSSYRQLAPRWGQHFSFNYRHIPSGLLRNKVSGSHFSIRSTFYFPGLLRTHSTSIRINYQHGEGTFSTLNDIPMVSGFDQLRPSNVANTVLINYRFPFAYPDWEIGPLAYIKRLKGGVFADFQNISRSNSSSLRPTTFGLEIRTDLNLLRFYLPNFDIGTRLIYAPNHTSGSKILMTYSLGYSY